MRNNRTLLIAEVAIMVALAVALSFIKFNGFWANGGSVSLEMLPIVMIAFRRGVKVGVVTGMIYGIVDFLMAPFFVFPLSILFDYPLAFLLVGFAGIVRPDVNSSKFHQGATVVFGTFIGCTLRFFAHFVSGYIWWHADAPAGMPIWIYSVVYNAGYMIPSFILTAAVMVLLVVTAPNLVKVRTA